jgi:sugar lactone lactonase YvrE
MQKALRRVLARPSARDRRDGTVYLTDSARGSVYRIPPDRDVLERVVPAGTFAYPNGLALADDHQLYVADAIGFTRIDPDTGIARPLAAPPTLALGGIDGLVMYSGQRLARSARAA